MKKYSFVRFRVLFSLELKLKIWGFGGVGSCCNIWEDFRSMLGIDVIGIKGFVEKFYCSL